MCYSFLYIGVDGQVFDGLNPGTYTITIEARGIENMQDIALYAIGPVSIVAGVNTTANEAIGKIILSLYLTTPSCLLFSCMLWKLENKL